MYYYYYYYYHYYYYIDISRRKCFCFINRANLIILEHRLQNTTDMKSQIDHKQVC